MSSTTALAPCYASQPSVPAEVAMYGQELPPIGGTVQWSVPGVAAPYEAQVLGFHREYGRTLVSTVLHADTCPARCISTRMRLGEGTYLDRAPVSVWVTGDRPA